MTAIRNLNAPPLFVAFDTPVADKGVSMIAPSLLAYLKAGKSDQLAVVSARSEGSPKVTLYPAVVRVPVGKSDFNQLVRKLQVATKRRGLTLEDFRILGTSDDVATTCYESEAARKAVREIVERGRARHRLGDVIKLVKCHFADKQNVTEESSKELATVMDGLRHCEQVYKIEQLPIDVYVETAAVMENVLHQHYSTIAAQSRALHQKQFELEAARACDEMRERLHTPPTAPVSLWLRLKNWFTNRD